jgi:hypothetical protein
MPAEAAEYPPAARAPSPDYAPTPKLKSTAKAKEVAFDADTDDIDDGDVAALPVPPSDPATEANESTEHEEGPLLQGLLTEGRRRGSVGEIDLEAHPWLRRGGGLASGIASESSHMRCTSC